ncbi:hypothetical protein, partial [Bifidobacterium longum]|uniref:hypothetical protein n=1 Tax=Bifidobacterium longum TaxID=216816 RepID=UPI001A954463
MANSFVRIKWDKTNITRNVKPGNHMGHGQPPRPRTVPRLNNKPGLIGMDDWMFPVPERGDRVKEH